MKNEVEVCEAVSCGVAACRDVVSLFCRSFADYEVLHI